MDQRTSNEKLYKIDLYSIPVFLLEVAVLTGLAYVAYILHFQYKPEPFLSGFYCDDISYRQSYDSTRWTNKFDKQLDLLTIVCLLMAAPILIITFCELVNSLFGSVRFRKIRAMHTCCKLHSITRRTMRFSAAYLLGLFLVMISCDILATSTGRLRPFFAQECPNAYEGCLTSTRGETSSRVGSIETDSALNSSKVSVSESDSAIPAVLGAEGRPPETSRIQQEVRLQLALERKWIDLTDAHLNKLCQFYGGDPDVELKFRQLALAWPSYPATLLTYACLYIACYLSFLGTARPMRIISSCLVVAIVLVAFIFNVQLVKEHYNHWQDVASGAALALTMVTFVLYVYLNKFRDFHYYQNQKFVSQAKIVPLDSSYGNYSAETTLGPYNLNEAATGATNNAMQNDETGGSVSNNDLAMRYFQIPRANYRGGNRPHPVHG